MKRIAAILIAFSMLLPLSASALSPEELYRDQLTASGAEEVYSQLPEESKELLHGFGIDGVEPEDFTALKPGALLTGLIGMAKEQSGGVVAACGLILAVLLLGALGASFSGFIREKGMGGAFSVICGGAACVTLLNPVAACAGQARRAADGVAALIGSYAPAYGAVLAAEGRGITASAYGAALLTASEIAVWILSQVTVPLFSLSLGVGAAGALSERNRLSGLSVALAKVSGRILTVTVGVFTAILSLQTMVAVPADSLALRTAKLSLSSFVPLVGGALGEAFGTVTGCLATLRSTLGAFGIAAGTVLILPALLRCILWSAALFLTRTAAEMMGVKPIVSLLETVGQGMRALIGVLLSMGMLVTVSTALVTLAGRQI